MSDLLRLFDLAVLCPECNSENVKAHWQTQICGGMTCDRIVSYSCEDCWTWFSPEKAVAK